jgi:YggT family protein
MPLYTRGSVARLLLQSVSPILNIGPILLPPAFKVAKRDRKILNERMLMADNFFVFILMMLLQALKWGLIVYAVLSWLIAFNVVNTRSPLVETINTTLYRIFEPILKPIRKVVPSLGGVDLSTLLLLILIIALQNLLAGNLRLF